MFRVPSNQFTHPHSESNPSERWGRRILSKADTFTDNTNVVQSWSKLRIMVLRFYSAGILDPSSRIPGNVLGLAQRILWEWNVVKECNTSSRAWLVTAIQQRLVLSSPIGETSVSILFTWFCVSSYESIFNTYIGEKMQHFANRNQKMVICSFLLADTPCLRMAASPSGGNLFHQISLYTFLKSMPSCENHHLSLLQWWSFGSWASAHSVGDREQTLTNHPTFSVCFLAVVTPNILVREARLTGMAYVTFHS